LFSTEARATLTNVWNERGNEHKRCGSLGAGCDGSSVAMADDDRAFGTVFDTPLYGACVGWQRSTVQKRHVNNGSAVFESVDERLHVSRLMVEAVHQHYFQGRHVSQRITHRRHRRRIHLRCTGRRSTCGASPRPAAPTAIGNLLLRYFDSVER